MFEHLTKDSDAETASAFEDPQVGDSFHEMYSFRMFVVAVERDGRVAVLTASPPCTVPNDGKIEVYPSHDAYRAAWSYESIPGYHIRLDQRGVNVSGWFAGWPQPETVDQDGQPSPHPRAFKVLYEAFRALDCTTALDPDDKDDCASVADEAVRALIAAGLLVMDGPS